MNNFAATEKAVGLIERPAMVLRADNDWVWVEASAQSACGGCAKGSDCGFGVLGKAFGGKSLALKIPNTFQAKARDKIIIGFSQTKLLGASVLAYLVPSVTTVAGALALAPVGGDGLAAVGALGGMILGFGLLRIRSGLKTQNDPSGAVYVGPDFGHINAKPCQSHPPHQKD